MQAAECHHITSKMICNPTVDETILILKASKNKKIQQKHEIQAQLHRGDLTGLQHLEGGCWERGSDLFQGVEVCAQYALIANSKQT